MRVRFQFTHPGRGATTKRAKRHISQSVSIHAPREGCDQAGNAAVNAYMQFQFTHPGRGATVNILIANADLDSFNSRTPGGVRHDLRTFLYGGSTFQFTHPGRGAT